uniref:Hypothetical secreted peptide n=1 Tax=Glossina morsitans morsitans TaxID=37546 RepID=D3TSH4_GLOMM
MCHESVFPLLILGMTGTLSYLYCFPDADAFRQTVSENWRFSFKKQGSSPNTELRRT